MPHYVNFNGKILQEDMPIVNAGNRGLRYGDGVFETMKMVAGEIRLESYHFERLFSSLQLLHFIIPPHFNKESLREQIRILCEKNNLTKAARVRLNVFRKNGGIYDPIDCTPEFVIEAWELPENYFRLNENGLIIDLFTAAKKSCDDYSFIKSNNYLPYAMAAFDAKKNKYNDSLLLNSYGRICDASIANVFWVTGQEVFTPPLAEGCIAGVMRRHLLELLPLNGYQVQERMMEVDELERADEIFLSNAIIGIRWVRQCRDKLYTNEMGTAIYALIR